MLESVGVPPIVGKQAIARVKEWHVARGERILIAYLARCRVERIVVDDQAVLADCLLDADG